MAANNKKKKAVAAVAAAAMLLLGGTFAWQSISQTALNEASDTINPGGRLHDDFNGTNKDVYVENFGDPDNGGQPIFARVRLDEYFEIVMNKDTKGEVTTVVTEGADKADKATWTTHQFGETNATDEFWDWATGGSTAYMPTFNKNKDSLVADVNGTYAHDEGAITDRGDTQYEGYTAYAEGNTLSGNAIYDYDSNDVDEVGTDIANAKNYPDNVKVVAEEHTAKSTQGATLISMAEWLALDSEEQIGEYWVYDEDGWVYWAEPIKPGMATGLLLDGISLDNLMDDSWYYGINVVAQFITKDDLGMSDNTGFFMPNEGPAPSSNALLLLDTIGVDVDGQRVPQTYDLHLTWAEDQYVNAKPGDNIIISAEEYFDLEETDEEGNAILRYSDLSSVTVYPYVNEDIEVALTEGIDYTYDVDTKTLVITNESVDVLKIYDNSGNFAGFVYFNGEGPDDENEYEDFYGAAITVNGVSPNEDGYVYLRDLDIEQNNTATVKVNPDYDLAEGGLTATFHEDGIKDTTFVVDENDSYSGLLTIASRDYRAVTITAESVDGERESVTVVPIYDTIVITPDMDGDTLYLPSDYYALKASDFARAVEFSLTGAKRCSLNVDNNETRLNISSYESSPSFTLAAFNDAERVEVTIVVLDNSPYDGPIYTYYVHGEGDVWSYAIVESQSYCWEQNDAYTYQVGVGLTNDFAGAIEWNIEGASTDDSVYFVDESGTKIQVGTGQRPNIKFTDEQVGPFILSAKIYKDQEKTEILKHEDGTPYDETTQYFKIIPVKAGHEAIRHLSVFCDDVEYGSAGYLAPQESIEVSFHASIAMNESTTTNADVTWELVTAEEGCSFEVVEGNAADKTAIVTHTCDTENCSKVGAVQVKVIYDHSYGLEEIGGFYIVPNDYAGSLDFAPSGGDNDEVIVSGNLILNYTESDEADQYWACDEMVTLTIQGYDDLSLFEWAIEDGGVHAVEGQPGSFVHYGSDTEEYQDCDCTTTIKATLKSDPEVWVAIEFPCA